MASYKKEVLEELERIYGLEAGDLSYPQRVKRASLAAQGKLDEYEAPKPKKADLTKHPLYGKKILISPLMTTDAKRNIYFEEVLSQDTIEVDEIDAGDMIYGTSADVDRMFGDYKVKNIRKDHPVVAKTTFPKSNTELTYTIGRDLAPVVRGVDGNRGYLWIYPKRVMYVKDEESGEVSAIQVMGLKSYIQACYPELLPRFSGKPIMSYIDGTTLAASIPQTQAILRDASMRRQQALAAGLDPDGGLF